MKTIATKRIVKIMIDDKHRKSFPLFMLDYVMNIPAEEIWKMSKGMRLTDNDHTIASPYVFDTLVNDYLNIIKKNEPYTYDVIKNAKIIGTRKVNQKYAANYFELYFDNNISMKCPEYIFNYSVNKMPALNRNY